MKNRILSILTALAITVSLSACQPSSSTELIDSVVSETTTTVSETTQLLETTTPENTDIVYETLAEGQERDWKVEDVLKNDLEIDEIPISIPCTVEELLDTLGERYSVNETNSICYNNEETMLSVSVIAEENTTSKICGFYYTHLSIYKKGVLGFRNSNETYYEIISKYSNPNELEIENDKIAIRYSDETYHFNCSFYNDELSSLYIGLNTGETEK